MPADFADRTDFDNAHRGLIARLEPGVIKKADGGVVWDAGAWGRATQGSPPDTVHPSLWRQSQLTAIQGLFEVTDSGERYRMELSNGVLIHYPTKHTPAADLTLTLTHPSCWDCWRPGRCRASTPPATRACSRRC
jgi:alkyl sulfatase BDS1-like metallo-beta-lactamase superfamily hydrolase